MTCGSNVGGVVNNSSIGSATRRLRADGALGVGRSPGTVQW